MKQVNETIGYINKHIFNLDTITNKVYDFIQLDKKRWEKSYDVNGKPNNKDINGFLYKTFIFDLKNPKLGSAKIILVNITDPKIESYKFNSFVENEEVGFYSVVDSIVDKGSKNTGYIYLSYNILTESPDNDIKDELEEYIYHELRHYYDNIIGVFSGSTLELIHITLIADELDINNKTFKEKKKDTDDPTYNALSKILYVSKPTELNAWYHSFVSNMLVLKRKHPEYGKDEILHYIKDTGLKKDDFSCMLYYYSIFYESFSNYKKLINSLCEKDADKLYYYINNTLNDCNPKLKTLLNLNNLFETKYLSYFTVDKIDKEIFGEKLYLFINEHYMKYIFKKVQPVYLHTVKNMNKFIATLV